MVVESVKLQVKKKNKVQVYRSNSQVKLRTTIDTIKLAEKTLKTLIPEKGIKGLTVLSKIFYNFIETTAIDTMHCVDLTIL